MNVWTTLLDIVYLINITMFVQLNKLDYKLLNVLSKWTHMNTLYIINCPYRTYLKDWDFFLLNN